MPPGRDWQHSTFDPLRERRYQYERRDPMSLGDAQELLQKMASDPALAREAAGVTVNATQVCRR
jgi:hypothetical protein